MEVNPAMSDTENRDFTLSLGTREATIALFMIVVLMGTFGAVAYIVGRAVPPVSAAEVYEQAREQVLVINPPDAAEAAPFPAAESSASMALVLPTAEPAPVTYASNFREPEQGELFLQVAAADPGVAEVFVEYLSRRSFPCQIAEGPDERNYRVLVGPIQQNSQVQALRSGLEAAGFRPFLRRY